MVDYNDLINTGQVHALLQERVDREPYGLNMNPYSGGRCPRGKRRTCRKPAKRRTAKRKTRKSKRGGLFGMDSAVVRRKLLGRGYEPENMYHIQLGGCAECYGAGCEMCGGNCMCGMPHGECVCGSGYGRGYSGGAGKGKKKKTTKGKKKRTVSAKAKKGLRGFQCALAQFRRQFPDIPFRIAQQRVKAGLASGKSERRPQYPTKKLLGRWCKAIAPSAQEVEEMYEEEARAEDAIERYMEPEYQRELDRQEEEEIPPPPPPEPKYKNKKEKYAHAVQLYTELEDLSIEEAEDKLREKLKKYDIDKILGILSREYFKRHPEEQEQEPGPPEYSEEDYDTAVELAMQLGNVSEREARRRIDSALETLSLEQVLNELYESAQGAGYSGGIYGHFSRCKRGTRRVCKRAVCRKPSTIKKMYGSYKKRRTARRHGKGYSGGRLRKGSREAKEYMAELRAMRGSGYSGGIYGHFSRCKRGTRRVCKRAVCRKPSTIKKMYGAYKKRRGGAWTDVLKKGWDIGKSLFSAGKKAYAIVKPAYEAVVRGERPGIPAAPELPSNYRSNTMLRHALGARERRIEHGMDYDAVARKGRNAALANVATLSPRGRRVALAEELQQGARKLVSQKTRMERQLLGEAAKAEQYLLRFGYDQETLNEMNGPQLRKEAARIRDMTPTEKKRARQRLHAGKGEELEGVSGLFGEGYGRGFSTGDRGYELPEFAGGRCKKGTRKNKYYRRQCVPKRRKHSLSHLTR